MYTRVFQGPPAEIPDSSERAPEALRTDGAMSHFRGIQKYATGTGAP